MVTVLVTLFLGGYGFGDVRDEIIEGKVADARTAERIAALESKLDAALGMAKEVALLKEQQSTTKLALEELRAQCAEAVPRRR